MIYEGSNPHLLAAWLRQEESRGHMVRRGPIAMVAPGTWAVIVDEAPRPRTRWMRHWQWGVAGALVLIWVAFLSYLAIAAFHLLLEYWPVALGLLAALLLLGGVRTCTTIITVTHKH